MNGLNRRKMRVRDRDIARLYHTHRVTEQI